MKKLILSAVASAALISGANAASVTLNGLTAEATIAQLISATTVSALNFGTIYTDNIGGTATLTSNVTGGQGTIAFTGALTGLGNQQQGIIQISSGLNTTATVALANPTITLTTTSTATTNVTMTASLNVQSSAGNTTLNLTAPAGQDTVYVGGALTVGATQSTGVYNGTYSLVVTY